MSTSIKIFIGIIGAFILLLILVAIFGDPPKEIVVPEYSILEEGQTGLNDDKGYKYIVKVDTDKLVESDYKTLAKVLIEKTPGSKQYNEFLIAFNDDIGEFKTVPHYQIKTIQNSDVDIKYLELVEVQKEMRKTMSEDPRGKK